MKLTDTELTRLAATAIMGWIVADANEDGKPLVYHPPQCPGRYVDACYWNPLTNWAHAGEVVEKMRADGWTLETRLGAYRSPRELSDTLIKFWSRPNPRGGWSADPSTTRAITIAALLATGAITEEQV